MCRGQVAQGSYYCPCSVPNGVSRGRQGEGATAAEEWKGCCQICQGLLFNLSDDPGGGDLTRRGAESIGRLLFLDGYIILSTYPPDNNERTHSTLPVKQQAELMTNWCTFISQRGRYFPQKSAKIRPYHKVTSSSILQLFGAVVVNILKSASCNTHMNSRGNMEMIDVSKSEVNRHFISDKTCGKFWK